MMIVLLAGLALLLLGAALLATPSGAGAGDFSADPSLDPVQVSDPSSPYYDPTSPFYNPAFDTSVGGAWPEPIAPAPTAPATIAGGAGGGFYPNGTVLPGDPHTWDNQIVYACTSPQTSGPALGADPLAPYVVKAIIKWESGFNPAAQNHNPGSDSYGLMQVDLGQHPEFTAAEMLDPNQNILAGVAILAGDYESCGGEWLCALAQYNGGSNPPPSSVTTYAPGVWAIAQNYAASAGLA